jgi:hypothetical protein
VKGGRLWQLIFPLMSAVQEACPNGFSPSGAGFATEGYGFVAVSLRVGLGVILNAFHTSAFKQYAVTRYVEPVMTWNREFVERFIGHIYQLFTVKAHQVVVRRHLCIISGKIMQFGNLG